MTQEQKDSLNGNQTEKDAKFKKACPESAKINEENEKAKTTAGIKENMESTVNIGTDAKAELQDQTLALFRKYPKEKTAKQYASILCWDLRIAQRTAMENYVEPMIDRGILILSKGNRYRLSPEYEKGEQAP